MSTRNLLRESNVWQVGLVILALIASLVAGGFYLLYPSPISPLIVGAAAVAIPIGIAWLRNPVWALYAAIFVVLLPEGLIPENIHSILNRSTLVVALAVWLLDVAERRRRIIWTGSALLMLGFVVWATITLFWTPDLDRGTERVIQYTLRLVLFLLLIVNEIDTEEALDGLMRTLAISGWILLLAGVFSVWFLGYEPGGEFAVLRMNVNQYGISILVTMPGVLWQVIRGSGQRKAIAMLMSVVFISLAVALVGFSGSRGSAISLLTTLLVFWFWKPTRPWGKVGLLIVLVAAVSAPFIFSRTIERFVEQASGGILGGRISIWQSAWLLIRDHLWTGVGIGNSSYAVVPYYERLEGVFRQDHRSIHNPVLAVWAETGAPGMLLYLGVLTYAVLTFLRQVRQQRTAGISSFPPYSALVISVFAGVMLSWIKGGGQEYHRTYFLMLALLLIPSHLDFEGVKRYTEDHAPRIRMRT